MGTLAKRVAGPEEGTGARVIDVVGGGVALVVAWDDADPISALLGTKGPYRYLAVVAWPDGALSAHQGHGTAPAPSELDRVSDLSGALGALGLRFGTGWGISPVGDPGEDGLSHSPGSVERAMTASADVRRFMDRVDERAVLAMGHFPFDALTYGMLAGDGARASRLRQRLADIPVLAGILSPLNADALADASLADLSGMLSEELAAPVAPGLLRRLRRLAPHVDQTREDTSRMLGLLSRMPVDHVPNDEDGLRLAVYLAKASAFLDVDAPVSSVPMSLPRQVARVMKALGVDREDVARPGRQLEILRDLPGFAADVLKAFSEDVVGPCIQRLGSSGPLQSEAPRIARDLLFGGRTLVESAETIGAWHRSRVAIEREMPAPREASVPWWRPCPDFVSADGIEVVPLVDWDALRGEGDPETGLDHCVGSRAYASSCARGESVILSFRRRAGGEVERLGTMELARSSSSLFHVKQRHGHANARFPAAAQTAFDEWRTAVVSGRCSFVWPASVPATGLSAGTDYPWEEAGTVERAFAAWRRVLPRDLSSAGPEEALGLSALARSHAG